MSLLWQILWPIIAMVVVVIAILIWALIAERYDGSWDNDKEDE